VKPQRIFLLRHGQSIGNIDRSIYERVPDYAVPLTPEGKEQARQAGIKLKSIINDETVQFYVSPYYRTRETFKEVKANFAPDRFSFQEDPRLREQEWTTHLREKGETLKIEKERDRIGTFYYRFPHGEAISDCYLRAASFLDTLFRDFEKEDFAQNVVIVGHGMQNRVLLMKFFHLTVEEFELLRNPKNGSFYLLKLQPNGKYKLSRKPERYKKSYRKF
jgi:broad specificity phosphatase PhoE